MSSPNLGFPTQQPVALPLAMATPYIPPHSSGVSPAGSPVYMHFSKISPDGSYYIVTIGKDQYRLTLRDTPRGIPLPLDSFRISQLTPFVQNLFTALPAGIAVDNSNEIFLRFDDGRGENPDLAEIAYVNGLQERRFSKAQILDICSRLPTLPGAVKADAVMKDRIVELGWGIRAVFNSSRGPITPTPFAPAASKDVDLVPSSSLPSSGVPSTPHSDIDASCLECIHENIRYHLANLERGAPIKANNMFEVMGIIENHNNATYDPRKFNIKLADFIEQPDSPFLEDANFRVASDILYKIWDDNVAKDLRKRSTLLPILSNVFNRKAPRDQVLKVLAAFIRHPEGCKKFTPEMVCQLAEIYGGPKMFPFVLVQGGQYVRIAQPGDVSSPNPGFIPIFVDTTSGNQVFYFGCPKIPATPAGDEVLSSPSSGLPLEPSETSSSMSFAPPRDEESTGGSDMSQSSRQVISSSTLPSGSFSLSQTPSPAPLVPPVLDAALSLSSRRAAAFPSLVSSFTPLTVEELEEPMHRSNVPRRIVPSERTPAAPHSSLSRSSPPAPNANLVRQQARLKARRKKAAANLSRARDQVAAAERATVSLSSLASSQLRPPAKRAYSPPSRSSSPEVVMGSRAWIPTPLTSSTGRSSPIPGTPSRIWPDDEDGHDDI